MTDRIFPRHKFTPVILVTVILFIAGCSPSLRPADVRSVSSFESIPHFIQVPLIRQGKDYTCGVAALQSILYFYGAEFREDQLMERLQPTPETGTKVARIADLARSLNFRVEIFTEMPLADLRRWIDAKKPVIVLIQAWPEKPVDYIRDWEDGHYAIVIGYDDQNIYLMDPSILGNYGYIPAAEFVRRWHDKDGSTVWNQFGMIITRGPPTYHPAEIKPIR